MSDRTAGELDRAILAYRENPTPENRAALDAAARAHNDAFQREQVRDFIERTSG